MDMKTEVSSLKRFAKNTGWLYFIFALAAIYNFIYVQPKIVVAGNAASAAKSIIANESLFRSGMAVAVIAHTLFVLVVLFLYRLLKQVNTHHARIMVGVVLIGIPVAFSADVFKITALSIFKGNLLLSFPLIQREDLAMLLMKIGSYASQMVTMYWGLWLLPLGMLVYRSGFIPKILGVLLIANGIGYMVRSFAFILFPQQLALISKLIFPTYFLGEIPFIIWLMIFGVREHLSVDIVSERENTVT